MYLRWETKSTYFGRGSEALWLGKIKIGECFSPPKEDGKCLEYMDGGQWYTYIPKYDGIGPVFTNRESAKLHLESIARRMYEDITYNPEVGQ